MSYGGKEQPRLANGRWRARRLGGIKYSTCRRMPIIPLQLQSICGVGNMAITIPNVGKVVIAQLVADQLALRVHLYTALAVAIDRDITLGDITEATYHGYVAQDVSGWVPSPPIAADWVAKQTGAALTWLATDNVVPNSILGAYYTNAGVELIGIEEFGTGPVAMNDAGKTFQTLPSYTEASQVNN